MKPHLGIRVLSGLFIFLFSAACLKPQTRGNAPNTLAIALTDSVRLPGQTTGFCAARDELLAADNMGTNVYRVGLDLAPLPPVALPMRVAGIRMLAADPFYLYVFDDVQLLRLDRSHGGLTSIASNVRALGAAVLSSGQLAFSDGFSDRVMILDPSGTLTDLNTEVAILPGALAFGPDGDFYVLDQANQRVIVLNRVGSFMRGFTVPGPSLKLAVDDSLNVYLLDRTGSRVWQVDRHGAVATVASADLGINMAATDMVISRGSLYLLSNGRTILKFRLPQ